MIYNNDQVINAFKLYLVLSTNGYAGRNELRLYFSDDTIRALVEQYAKESDCTIFTAGDNIYMIPLSKDSMFHVTNDSIKKDYLASKAANLDIYLMYVSIIVLFGEFYDSYSTTEATRDFITTEEWLKCVNDRIETLSGYDEEKLKMLDREYDYNWSAIVKKWTDMDEIKENAKRQDARTISRVSFLVQVKNFLIKNELILDIGNNEIELTEKAMIIVQRYYMEYDYNRGILDFMYGLDNKKESDK